MRVVESTTVTVPWRPPEREDSVPEYPILSFPWPKALEMRPATRIVKDKEGIMVGRNSDGV
jgi:hypothetical protein